MTQQQRESRRQQLYSLIGILPPRNRPIQVLNRQSQTTDKYELETLLLDLNGLEPVPAYFVKPHAISPSPGTPGEGRGGGHSAFSVQRSAFPVILYNHWHGGQYQKGKEGLLHPSTKAPPKPYAEVFTELGYSALCIDHWAFGQRSTRTESDIFKDMLWRGQVLWGMMVYDSLRAVDYLATRDDIDPTRIGTLGMSMGSTMAWWLAALDERIKVCIDICCQTDFQALLETNNLKGHGLYYYVPALLNHFTAAEINELIVPRPHLALAGNLDTLTPPAGLDRIDAALKKTYAAANVPDRWQMHREDVGHQETAAMRAAIIAFLQKWL